MKRFSSRDVVLYLMLLLLMIFAVNTVQQMDEADDPTYSQVRTLFEQEKVKYFVLNGNDLGLQIREEGDKVSTVHYQLPDLSVFYSDLHELIDQQHESGVLEGYDYKVGIEGTWWYRMLPYLVLLLVMAAFWYMMYLRQSGGSSGGGPGPSRFGHARTRTLADQGKKVTFQDVAGAEEEKEELREIVDFLRDPQKFISLGARIPKGVLLVGPPGTGKTLIAKAVAGEAGVHFLSISGSDFVELYGGVGASRVRDLFDQAKKEAPAIVFIDEIDAVGRQRGAGLGGGHDEREQTLNQLLTEMDGFDGSKGVVVLAATNRPDSLDPALLRPGRFDRQIYVGLPDIRGREEILKVHAKKIRLAEDVNFEPIAKTAAGASGAELANIVNEAALRAVRSGRQFATQEDLQESVEVVIAGYQKKSRVLSDQEKKIVAYHETGHALVAALQSHSAPVQKITIIPRTSGALGYTLQVDEGDHFLMSREELLNKIATYTGGRAAEELVFHSVTTGASNDIEQATKLARAMISRFGMSEEFGFVAFETVSNQYLGGDASLACSPETQARMDQKVTELVSQQYRRAVELLRANEGKLHQLAGYLYEHETITGEEFMEILSQSSPELDPLAEQPET